MSGCLTFTFRLIESLYKKISAHLNVNVNERRHFQIDSDTDQDLRRATGVQGCWRWQTGNRGMSSPPCCPDLECSASGAPGSGRSRGWGTSGLSGFYRHSGRFHPRSCSVEAERSRRSKDDEQLKHLPTITIWGLTLTFGGKGGGTPGFRVELK